MAKRWSFARLGKFPKRWAIARPRIVGYRGSAHPPAEPPARRDPERGCAGGCRADGQPEAHSPGRPCRGGASAPRWRPCPFTRHPHDSGDRLARLPSLPPLAPAAPPVPRHRARLSFDLARGNPALPISANGFRHKRAAHAARPIHDPKPVSGDHAARSEPMHDPTNLASFDLRSFDPVARPKRQAGVRPAPAAPCLKAAAAPAQ